MIRNSIAQPIVDTAVKAFENSYDPSKPTIQYIFHNHWDEFCEYLKDHPEITVRPVVFSEVDKMIVCGTLDMGFEVYECPTCHRHHVIAYTCKSRFCPSCGIKATKIRAFHISNSTLNVKHRHIVFTIDERLRPYFKKHRDWLCFLFDSAWEAIYYVFRTGYARKNDVFIPGAIITLHTFGRALNWNPHVHCLVTEGGMSYNNCYKHIQYINYETLRKAFMKQLLDKMRDALPKGSKEYKQFMDLRVNLYKLDSNGFYVYAPPVNVKGDGKNQVVQYIIRYAGRPPMAQSRITSYDFSNKSISYWYEDHKTHKYIEVSEHIFQFFLKLIQHIPETQFKLVRYFGLYASCDHHHKEPIKRLLSKSKSFFKKPKYYRLDLISTFGVDPFLCTCGSFMEFVDSFIPSKFRSFSFEDP